MWIILALINKFLSENFKRKKLHICLIPIVSVTEPLKCLKSTTTIYRELLWFFFTSKISHHLDGDKSVVCLDLKVQIIWMTDEFLKFRFSFENQLADPNWTVLMKMVMSKLHSIYYHII